MFKEDNSGVISEEQSAFISDRQILDCILVANEAMDDIRKKKKKAAFLFKVDFEKAFFKVDFEKAYDSLSGSYLPSVMPSMGFDETWRNWIRNVWSRHVFLC